MEVFSSNKGVSAYAYKGDAMTLLAFDLDEDKINNFAGFTINVIANGRSFPIYNKLTFRDDVKLSDKPRTATEKLSTKFSPIQKFRWIHVPSTIHFVENPYFGEYTYEITPRYLINKELLNLDPKLTISLTINVSPFKDGEISVGFTRSFISSQAFAYHFGNKLNLRPKGSDLVFNIKDTAGIVNRYNPETGKKEETNFSYEEIHEYLGWQVRDRIMEFLDEVISDETLELNVFAYDLNEPTIIDKILKLASVGRVKIILDNYPNHNKADSPETLFEAVFAKSSIDKNKIFRGHYGSQAHSKIFIQRKIDTQKATKVLTGSTNFAVNGLYVNANHTLTFNNPIIAQIYAEVFDASFGKEIMKNFKKSNFSSKDHNYKLPNLPDLTIRFSPHKVDFVDSLFLSIKNRISNAKSDILFAIMKDDSQSDILDALQEKVKSDIIFTAGITDVRKGMQLYKPDQKTGIRISGLNIETTLKKPFSDIIKVPGLGHSIHHKFIVVDFKGDDPVVFCGSSNLAYGPEQKNGDNLIEIRDKDVVTAFAIEAIRLIDHYSWLNNLIYFEDKEKKCR